MWAVFLTALFLSAEAGAYPTVSKCHVSDKNTSNPWRNKWCDCKCPCRPPYPWCRTKPKVEPPYPSMEDTSAGDYSHSMGSSGESNG
jgi:hypothetical protein